jgi:hypothetical protein
MNKTKKMAFGIGIALAVLAVLPTMAAADINVSYFSPQHASAETGNYDLTTIYFNITEGTVFKGAQIELKFDPLHVDIPDGYIVKGCPAPAEGTYCWEAVDLNYVYTDNGYMWIVITGPQVAQQSPVPPFNWEYVTVDSFTGPMQVKMCDCWVVANATGSPGVSPFDFAFEYFPSGEPVCLPTGFYGQDGIELDWTWENGTFTHDYAISGYIDPAATRVNITNMNKPDVVDDRAADVNATTGFYSLALDMPSEVNTGDELRIIACDTPDNYTSNCNVTYHTVVTAPGTETVNLTLNHYCQNYYPSFPFHTWEESDWSGPAAMEMLIDNYRDTSDVPNQTVLNATGLGYNQACNADILFVDPLGMRSTLNLYLHAYEGLPYVANYGIGSYTTIEDVLHYICKWQYLGPGAAPAYGNYSNWMVIRGIHTNKTPSFTQGSYEIYGFWINDPFNTTLEGPGGIGENTYKSVDQWSSIYHKKLNESGVNTSDSYYNKYVAVCEPPEDDDVEVTLAHAKPRFADAIAPMLAEEPMMVYGIEQLALEKVVKDDESLKIVKAAIEGVTEELVPYDNDFADLFAKTVPGKPKLVTSDNGDYYVVPFNVPAKVRPPVKRMPVEIERPKMSGLRKLERVKRVAANAVIEPIVIEPLKVERTLVVVLVDAEDGSFKEASWVDDPVKYLPVSKIAALKLALGKIDITSARDIQFELRSKPTIELVYTGESPYYPDWKITVGGTVFYVSQDGTVSA